MATVNLQRNARYLSTTVQRLKASICQAAEHKKFDTALTLLSCCSAVLYSANQCYTDDFLEHTLCQIAEQVLPNIHIDNSDKSRILFYDGFGYNSRGLIRIYLTALCKIGHVVYVTNASHKDEIPDVLDILKTSGADVVWQTQTKPVAAIRELYGIFQQYRPGIAFLYTQPHDVVSASVFSRLRGIVERLKINLTDHAYWLGVHTFDRCIEFRDYGAVISREGRNVPAEKLVKLPFYPTVDKTTPFQGIPFPVTEGQKVIFSGGSLYKTRSSDNLYYTLVSHILEQYPDTVFWYAGSGDRRQMDILLKRYPGRAFLTNERTDLHQVLEHCFFYLSTYPITGGLMFQHAACAGKIPVTLRYDSDCDGYLLDQPCLGFEANTLNEAMQLIHKIITDDAFREEKEKKIQSAVLTQTEFEQQLRDLVFIGKTAYPITYYTVDVEDLRQQYLAGVTRSAIASAVTHKQNIPVARYFPFTFAIGCFQLIKEKLFG